MGADGGSIPKRCELVKNKKADEKFDKNVKLALKWRICQLTQEKLRKPIVACKYGRLYNKDSILEGIISKTLSKTAITKHIKNMKDIKELKLTDNKEYIDNVDKGDTFKDHNKTPFICPVTFLPMNGIHTFYVNWKCGCVFSEKALKEVKTNNCYGCSCELNQDDLVMLNPDEETAKIYEKKLENERLIKKENKRKRNIDKISLDPLVPDESPNSGKTKIKVSTE
ncbi:Protein RTF2 homolog [Strongyloides ratti]|uniref:Replication termination factor 2 n=1 Tax=Strongyloides ratti TaxID=34506 RepID=A0A090L1Q6_STRRB|nr:Protein RTF2 homolog [Strongyloides ratti]CEF63632.1 Protein RTF2 homolog [Strongyloides ratti]